MGMSDDVERVVAPVLEAASLELVDVELRGGSLVVTVDRDGGVDLDLLGSLSREISGALDLAGAGPKGHYELEVSSPGLERRLRRPEHFARFVGHEVALRTKPGVPGDRRLQAVIAAADKDRVTFADPASPKGERTLAYGEIERAHTVFDWKAALAGTAAPTAASERRARSHTHEKPTSASRIGRELTETA